MLARVATTVSPTHPHILRRANNNLTSNLNLPGQDKAAAILADYRQVKKTSILAFHLLKYFKKGLLIQAAWAAISGLITFVPTLLLKAILEYVENPSSVPRNAAWFYVFLLFVEDLLSHS